MILSRAALGLLLTTALAGAQDNILLLIGDDLGVERVAAYGEHRASGRTPNLDRLAAGGIIFRNAWATPFCSPTRATILTGRYPFRTGVGALIGKGHHFALSTSEITLPELLQDGTGGAYHCAALGKWHLAGVTAPSHPFLCGFDLHSGTTHNIDDYFQWPKSVNGTVGISTVYATTDTTDDALRVIQESPEPWFLWVAYHAPHAPRHVPPDPLHSFALAGEPDDTPVVHTKAMIEAMDTEIGRLLSSIDPAIRDRTTVIFVGDNGTASVASDGPFPKGKAKGSCFEGGVNVPLIVNGPHVAVPGGESGALIHTVDIYSTVAEIAGFDAATVLPPGHALDSISLIPYLHDPSLPSLRHVVFTERFHPNGSFDAHIFSERAVRSHRYKLIRHEIYTGPFDPPTINEAFFDLEIDPLENRNLLLGTPSTVEREALLRLRARLLAP